MIRVTSKARLEIGVLLDCKEDDEAISIVKDHMRAALMQVVLDMKRDGFDVEIRMNDHHVAYETA